MFRLRIATLVAVMAALSSHSHAAETANQPPGARFEVLPSNLPAPDADHATANQSESVPRPAGAGLRVPEGFAAELFAEKLDDARYLDVAPNGDVLLAEPEAGKVTVLRDETGSGHATKRFTLAQGFDRPHGVTIHDGYVYIADTKAVWRLKWNPQDGTVAGDKEQVTKPGELGEGTGHFTRNIVFAPDGKHFYVTIGSRSNVAEDPEPRATIKEFDAAGGTGRIFASGLRNPVGIRFQPGTNDVWAVVNERDGLGDGLVPDYLTRVVEGGFYGWPYAYLGQHKQPGPLGDKRPDLVAKAIVPDVLFQSHSAPLGLVFYEGAQFPADFQGDAFVSLHGSWNAGEPRGYKVVRVKFHNGKPETGYENFATGFWVDGTKPARVWGRPVGLALAKDGSLLVADDVGQTVWRIYWVGK
jgi:glucose/arabinose dehydrogenase